MPSKVESTCSASPIRSTRPLTSKKSTLRRAAAPVRRARRRPVQATADCRDSPARVMAAPISNSRTSGALAMPVVRNRGEQPGSSDGRSTANCVVSGLPIGTIADGLGKMRGASRRR